MRENMPGQGYAQGHVDLVDRGPRTENTFDAAYISAGLLRQLTAEALILGTPDSTSYKPLPRNTRGIGSRGTEADVADRRTTLRNTNVQYDENGNPEQVPFAYSIRPAAEEAYINALYEFFSTRIDLWPAAPMGKEYLRLVMHDPRSTREIGDDMGVSHEAVVQGRKRAVASFTEFMGGKQVLADKLRQYLFEDTPRATLPWAGPAPPNLGAHNRTRTAPRLQYACGVARS